MAAITVSFDGTRVDDAEDTTDWDAHGSGVAATQEGDFFYQGTFSVSGKLKTTQGGIYYWNAVTSHDLTSPERTIIFKHIATTSNNLGDEGAGGGIVEIGNGDRTNYYQYYVVGGDTYPSRGGWLITPIDTNITQYRDNTVGTPDITAVDFYGWTCTFGTSAKAENAAVDAIDFIDNGTGLTLTGGDVVGSPPSATFQDIVDFDEETVTNRYGLVTTLEGILYVVGILTIGDSGSPPITTVFDDTNQTLVFPDGLFNTGFSGIKLILPDSSTNILTTTCTFIGRGFTEVGSPNGPDTRPIFEVTGTIGSSTIAGCNFINFSDFQLTSSVTLQDSSFTSCGSMTQNSATIDGCTIDQPTVDPGVAFLIANDLDNVSNSDFIGGSTGSPATTGHAIEIPSAAVTGSPAVGAYILVNLTYTGYGADGTNDAAIFNNSGGTVTLSISGGDTPTVRNGPGSTTIIENAVTVRVQGVTEAAAVKVIANETAGTITTGDTIFEQLADAEGVAEITNFNYESAFDPSGLDIIVRVRSSGLPAAAIQDDNGVFIDETEDANTVTGSPIPQINLLPAVPVVNQDRYLFGHPEIFDQLKLVINTPGTGGFTITWQYWNGATWENLLDVVDNTNSFSVAGKNTVSWSIGSPGWAKTTINGQGPYYYVRAAYTAGTVTIVPTADKVTLDVTKYLPFVQETTISSTGVTVTASWVEDNIATF